MNGLFVRICVFTSLCIILGCIGADDQYCFRFTWMGPGFNNESYMNDSSSCEDTYDNCKDPILITLDGTPPDYDYVWKTQEREKIACRMSKGFVCAKWTSYYEDTVEYSMHLCSKITVEGEGAMTSGCLSSTLNNSRHTEVCACNSFPNEKPCNSAPHPWAPLGLLLVALSFVCLR